MNNPKRKRRGNSRYVVYFVIALVVTIASVVGIYHALMHVSWFDLQKIQVRNNQHIPTEMIEPAASKFVSENLLSIPTKEIANEISQIARVKNVKVRRKLLHTLVITVFERDGFLYVKSLEGDLYPLDSEGIILENLTSYYSEDLPVINTYLSGDQLVSGQLLDKAYIKRILSIHKSISEELPDFVSQISEYFMVDDTVYMIDARYGTRFIPSEDDLIGQLKRYIFVQDNGNVDRNTVIDLRFKNQVVVKAGN
jgi:cell division septal protein FtsQ